jgi:hypothetical protein
MSLINLGDRNIVVEKGLVRIACIDGEKFKFLDDPQELLTRIRHCGPRIDLFTFIQRVSDTTPLYSYPMELDNLAVLPISTFEHWWEKQIGFKARNKAKQAQKKGVTLREVSFDESLVEGIWQIYNESPIRQGRRFPHYGKTVGTVHREASTFPDSSVFIGAFLGDRMIGFTKLVIDETKTQAGLMHIVSLLSQRDKAPTNALVAEAVRACAKRNISYLSYSNFAYGKKQHDSLSDFKERNGFQRVDLPRYYVPLTPVGSLALRLGLHHKMADRIPEPLAARLREFRNKWNNRKLPATAEVC